MINRIPDLEAEDKFAQRIIGAAMDVHSALGCGFLESIYVNALMIELNNAGLKFEREKRYPITYKGTEIGHFNADLVIENRLIVEVKAIETLCVAHSIQLVNYLAASKIETGLLLNSAPNASNLRPRPEPIIRSILQIFMPNSVYSVIPSIIS